MKITDRIWQLPGGAAVPAGTTVTLKKISDNSIVGTTTTDANGFFTFTGNGSPGPVYFEATVGSQTRRKYGSVVGQHGTWFEGEWDAFMRLFGDGAFTSTDLAITPGTGLQVVVASGTGLAAGICFTATTATNLAIAANSSGNPRVDLVVLRAYRTGADAGRTELAVLTGTPAVSPVAPTPTQTSALWEVGLAQVAVANGAGSLITANLTDVRPIVTAPVSAEVIQDTVAGMLLMGTGMVGTYDDPAGKVTLSTAIKANQGTTQKVAATSTFQFDSAKFSVAADDTDTHKALIGLLLGGAAIPNLWFFAATGTLSSGSRTVLSQPSSVLKAGTIYDWIALYDLVAPNNVNSGRLDLTVTVNGSARTRRITTNGGVTGDHLVPGAGSGITGTGVDVSVSASVAHVDGDVSTISDGWVLVLFLPRS